MSAAAASPAARRRQAPARDDIVVANCLLNEGHVASVPRTAYEFSPYFRILTATNEALLT
jgi:hypothetical protein